MSVCVVCVDVDVRGWVWGEEQGLDGRIEAKPCFPHTHAPMGKGFSLSSMNSASVSNRFSTPGGSAGARRAAVVFVSICVCVFVG